MHITQPGWITKRILLLGREESSIYLLNGEDEAAILGGGMSYIVPDVLEQLNRFEVDESRITRLIIHHSHFDHVGAVSFFKKRWPHVVVTASTRAAEQLNRDVIMSSIRELNSLVLADKGMNDLGVELGLDADRILVEKTVEDGETISLGNLTMQFIAVPGHSSCSMAVYVPEEKALFASDAGGIPFGDRVFSAANSNFDQYQASLEKMAAYDVRLHAAEHYGALTGDEAMDFQVRSIEAARFTRSLIEDDFKRTKDIEVTANRVTDIIMTEGPGYFLPRDVMRMVVGQMTRFIAGRLNPV